MSQPVTALSLELETRIRRSQGRTGRTHSANVKLTRDELSELEIVAKVEQKALGEWAREVLLREVRRAEGDAVLAEVIATRMLLLNLLKPVAMGKTVSQEWITEAMAAVRREKRKAAREVMQQYQEERKKER